MRIALFTIVLCFISISGFAQIDTEFWFAAPDLEVNHAQAPIRFCVVSYEEAANVVFEQPANPNYNLQSFHINANDCYVYDVSNIINMVETQPYNEVLNYGFYIHSDTPVSIYYESDNNNSEIYSLKGRNALGTSFVIPTQYTFENFYSSTCSRVEVIAIEDDTEVTFMPSVPIKGGGMPGVPVIVSLNRGQSYAIEAASPQPSAHIRNTRVTSTKPIAVNTSDDSVNLDGHYDLVGDQIVPIDLMGTDYIAIWNNNPNEYLYFFPTVDNTNIYLNGNSLPAATLNVGQEYDCRINTPVVYIHADYPIAVFQMSSSSLNEFGGTVLPQISCTGSRKTVYKRQSTSNLVVTLIVRTQYTDGFRLNGNANYINASDFAPVPANTEYSYCKKDVTAYVPTNGLLSLENIYPDGYFHLGILTGIDGTWNYGYFSDYQPYAFAEFQMADTYCSGQDIEFMYSTENVSNLHLILPDGTEAQLPYILYNAQVEHSGHYSLQGEDCNGVRVLDEMDIIVTDPVETTISLEGCSHVEWNGISFNHSIDSTWFAPAGSNGCDSIFRLNLTVWPENEIDLKEVSLCPEQLPYSFYGVDYYDDVEVTIHDTDIHGCDSTVMLLLTVSDYYMPEPITKYVGYYDTPMYNWYIPEANMTLTYTTEGLHIDTLPTSTCEGIFTLDLHFRHIPEVHHDTAIACNTYDWIVNGQIVGTYANNVDETYSIPMCDDPNSPSTQYMYYDPSNPDHPIPCTEEYMLHLTMDYTPHPYIEGKNSNPHYPITATEFNVNRYTYTVKDDISDISKWIIDQCKWDISKDSWRIEPNPSGNNPLECMVYAMDWVADSICLSFKAVNDCESTIAEYWLYPSFYGIDEDGPSTSSGAFDFSIVPNLNDGQMKLVFSRFEGKVEVKVYDVMGNLMDNFESYSDMESKTVEYQFDGSKGIYFFVANGKEGTVAKKVVIR